VRHKNLVELVGYSINNSLVLVYEFMPQGSLYDALFGKPIDKFIQSRIATISYVRNDLKDLNRQPRQEEHDDSELEAEAPDPV
jgi:hypothetical protein